MARRKIAPNTILLTLVAEGGTAKHVVCLTQLGTSESKSAINADSFCGVDRLPGVLDGTISFTAQRILEPLSTEYSEKGIFDLFNNGTAVDWTIGAASPVTGDIVDSGTGLVTAFNTSNDLNGVPTMTGTVQIFTHTKTVTP
jgi:hypothetical protein